MEGGGEIPVYSPQGGWGSTRPSGAAAATRRPVGAVPRSAWVQTGGHAGRSPTPQLLSAGSGAPRLRRNRRTKAIAGYGEWVPRGR